MRLSNLVKECPILIKELEAMNALSVVVIDSYLSDCVEDVLVHNESIISLCIFIFLSRSDTIGQDEISKETFTILLVVLKTSEVVQLPTCTHLFYHRLSRKFKRLGVCSVKVNFP